MNRHLARTSAMALASAIMNSKWFTQISSGTAFIRNTTNVFDLALIALGHIVSLPFARLHLTGCLPVTHRSSVSVLGDVARRHGDAGRTSRNLMHSDSLLQSARYRLAHRLAVPFAPVALQIACQRDPQIRNEASSITAPGRGSRRAAGIKVPDFLLSMARTTPDRAPAALQLHASGHQRTGKIAHEAGRCGGGAVEVVNVVEDSAVLVGVAYAPSIALLNLMSGSQPVVLHCQRQQCSADNNSGQHYMCNPANTMLYVVSAMQSSLIVGMARQGTAGPSCA
jgi:hypothetical protein